MPSTQSEVNDLGVEQSTLLTRKGFKESRSPQATLGSEKARAYKRGDLPPVSVSHRTFDNLNHSSTKQECLSKVPTLLPGHVVPCVDSAVSSSATSSRLLSQTPQRPALLSKLENVSPYKQKPNFLKLSPPSTWPLGPSLCLGNPCYPVWLLSN